MFTIPAVFPFADFSLLFGLVVAMVLEPRFQPPEQPRERARSIGLSVPFTVFIGVAEFAGAIALTIGFLAQWAALGLILVMFGAIYTKIAKWKTGFWGDKSMGWHYDLLFIAMNLVILTTGGGRFVIF